ncbi:5359_t:CDS:2, partial [Entrophospora sp. SA101]
MSCSEYTDYGRIGNDGSSVDKLEEATKSNNKEEIKNALNEASKTVKNSSDPDLKKKKDQAEDKLGDVDPEELRKIIKTE